MAKKKITNKYYFTVEGETEGWYLDWLAKKINNETAAKYRVSIDSKIQTPIKRIKSLPIISKVKITHLYDYESNEEVHTTRFLRTLDSLKTAAKLGKQIKYDLGYSNFTFELWMVLHKTNCNSFNHRDHYLAPINRAYGENFENLAQYKHESNFKRVLGKISLQEVVEAIERAKVIMQRNTENELVLIQYKGFKYYRENPSLLIHESVERILKDCGLINN